ncbi:hypothetical protein ACPA9J_02110 [Pseudomonas aeruginosa]
MRASRRPARLPSGRPDPGICSICLGRHGRGRAHYFSCSRRPPSPPTTQINPAGDRHRGTTSAYATDDGSIRRPALNDDPAGGPRPRREGDAAELNSTSSSGPARSPAAERRAGGRGHCR